MYTNNINANLTAATVQSPSYLAYIDNLIRTTDVILLNSDTVQKGAAFDALIRVLVPILDKYKRQITLLQATYTELKFLTNSPDVTVSEKAEKAMDGINVLSRAGYILFRGDPHARETSGAAIVKFVFTNIWDKNILILTQSKDVFKDCMLFNQIRSTNLNHTVTVKRISDLNGRIGDFSENRDSVPTATSEQRTEQRKTNTTDANTAEILKRFGL